MTEQVNNNGGLLDLDPFAAGDAVSFFDVFFEIDLPDGTVLHNEQSLRIEAVIDEKPPRGGRCGPLARSRGAGARGRCPRASASPRSASGSCSSR